MKNFRLSTILLLSLFLIASCSDPVLNITSIELGDELGVITHAIPGEYQLSKQKLGGELSPLLPKNAKKVRKINFS